MSLLRFSFQNETLILDDLLYLCKVNAVRHSYLYESFLGAREAQKKDVNTCFNKLNYLACKRGNFVPERNPFWNNVKGILRTDHQIFDPGGGGVFCQLHDVFSSIKPMLDFFAQIPSEFQVIISGSKKQQQKDSYQSEVPFPVIVKVRRYPVHL